MAQEIHLGVSSVYKEANEAHIGVGGAWKDCDEVYVGVSGVWEQIFQKVVVSLSGESINDSAPAMGTAWAELKVRSDGTLDKKEKDDGGDVYVQIDSATDWIIPNASHADATYVFRLTVDSGDTPSGSAVSSWIAKADEPAWYHTVGGIEQLKSGSYTLEVSDDAGSTTLASATYTLSASTGAL